jgi:hypothetical protein
MCLVIEGNSMLHPRDGSASDKRPRSLRSKCSATGSRTRVARVRAEYPNQLDYSGFWRCGAGLAACPRAYRERAPRHVAARPPALIIRSHHLAPDLIPACAYEVHHANLAQGVSHELRSAPLPPEQRLFERTTDLKLRWRTASG